METKIIEKKYFFFGLLLLTAFSAFLIFRPFISIIIIALAFAVWLAPFYRTLNKKINSWLASFLTLLFFVIVLCLPIFGAGSLVLKESKEVYKTISEKGAGAFVNELNSSINGMLPGHVNFDLKEQASSLISVISENTARVLTSTLGAIFSFFLLLIMIFYFLKDGERWKKSIVAISPLSDHDDEKILGKLGKAMNGIISGYLLIALLQGTLMGLGLWLFGVPNPALWGMITAVASLVPMVGISLVTIPAILFILVSGNIPQAIGLLVWSIALVGMVDNLLSPFLVGNKINLPPVFVLFAVLGGIALLGPAGIIVGPVVISLLYALLPIYRNEFKPK